MGLLKISQPADATTPETVSRSVLEAVRDLSKNNYAEVLQADLDTLIADPKAIAAQLEYMKVIRAAVELVLLEADIEPLSDTEIKQAAQEVGTKFLKQHKDTFKKSSQAKFAEVVRRFTSDHYHAASYALQEPMEDSGEKTTELTHLDDSASFIAMFDDDDDA